MPSLTPAQRVTLRLPFPPKELSPNVRVPHWAVFAHAKSYYRKHCWGEAFDQTNARLSPPVHARVTFVVPDRRRRDADNLAASLKSMWDALVDAHVLADDSADKLTIEAPVIRYEKGQRYIEVTLEEVLA